MSKILELNGYKYSREKFEGYKFRTMFRLGVSDDWRKDTLINIYTDNPSKEDVNDVIQTRTSFDVIKCELEHWTTKEQDELSSKFLNEILKDI